MRALTDYYKESIPQGSAVLDICSSWVSHFPEAFPKQMTRISGTGMNAPELEANRQLSDWTPKNLNIEPKLPYADDSFDVVTCVVSVDYLIHPLEVFREARRVLKPGGKFILSQSNRMFQTKAIRMWLGMDDLQVRADASARVARRVGAGVRGCWTHGWTAGRVWLLDAWLGRWAAAGRAGA